jgi:hypothetical protein
MIGTRYELALMAARCRATASTRFYTGTVR